MTPEPELPLARPVPPAPAARRGPRPGTPHTGRIVRLSLLAVGGVLACVFAVAYWLNPYDADGRPRAMATHTQLGMPPCNFVLLTGNPCPACGMTTSFALLVRGEVTAALHANWVGVVIAVIGAVAMFWAIAGGIVGRPLFIPRDRGELVLTVLVGVVVVLMLGRWGVLLIR